MKTKGELTREAILSAAQKLANTKGFGATSINDLLAATGLSKGSLYFHFPDKQSLGLAILEKAHDDFRIFLTASLTGNTPGTCLENFFHQVLSQHLAKGFVGGCLWGNTALEMSDSDTSFASVVEHVFDEWAAGIEEKVAAAQRSGDVRSDIHAKALALHIVATIEGGIMLSRLKKNEQPMRYCLETMREMLKLA
jgi:TetR/AcrR family transcriptional regulator, transcriptional repressor for nem operon